MFEDMMKSLRVQFYDKTSSPLMGSFVVSWLAWNYKFVLLIFSGETWLSKVSFIDNVLYPSWKECLSYGGVFPLITAALYIFAYPYPAKWVFKFSRTRQRELNKVKQDIDKESLLTAVESQALKAKIEEVRKKLTEQIEEKDAYISELEKELENNVSKINLEEENESIILTKFEAQIMDMVKDKGVQKILEIKELGNASEIMVALQHLYDYEFLEYDHGISGEIVKLRPKGAEYLINNPVK